MFDMTNPVSQSETAIRVLVVEDQSETLERFASVIQADPHTTLAGVAATGHDAIEALKRNCPHVLLVDLGLPDMSGLDVIRHAVRSCPATDIMVITMFGDEASILSAIEAGATGYLLKDCSDRELVHHLLDLRAGGSPISPVIARRLLGRMRSSGATTESAAPQAAIQTNPLTARETEVLQLIAQGYTYAEVGEALGISLHTVTSHIKNSYRKLSVCTSGAAVARVAALGLLKEP